MLLNLLWLAFFVSAFLVAAVRLAMGDMEVFPKRRTAWRGHGWGLRHLAGAGLLFTTWPAQASFSTDLFFSPGSATVTREHQLRIQEFACRLEGLHHELVVAAGHTDNREHAAKALSLARARNALVALVHWVRQGEKALPVMEAYRARGGDMNGRDHRGHSALGEAISSLQPAVVAFLLRAGADRAQVAPGISAQAMAETVDVRPLQACRIQCEPAAPPGTVDARRQAARLEILRLLQEAPAAR